MPRNKKTPPGRAAFGGTDDSAGKAVSVSKFTTYLTELQASIEADDQWLADWLAWFNKFCERNRRGEVQSA